MYLSNAMPHESTRRLPSVRRDEIRRRLRDHGQVKVGDLAKALAVSTMTIERDLAFLEREGDLIRIRGGATASTLVGDARDTTSCLVCGCRADERFVFRIHTGAGSTITACCPHCGLTLLAMEAAISGWYAITPDALTGRMVNVRDAVFVIGSVVAPCCSPSVLCLTDPGDADRFVTGFGGHTARLDEATTWVRDRMVGRVSRRCEWNG